MATLCALPTKPLSPFSLSVSLSDNTVIAANFLRDYHPRRIRAHVLDVERATFFVTLAGFRLSARCRIYRRLAPCNKNVMFVEDLFCRSARIMINHGIKCWLKLCQVKNADFIVERKIWIAIKNVHDSLRMLMFIFYYLCLQLESFFVS